MKRIFSLLLLTLMCVMGVSAADYTFKGDYKTTCSGNQVSGNVSPYDKGATVNITKNGNNYDFEITGLYVKIFGSNHACSLSATNVPISNGVITTTEASSKKSDSYVCSSKSTVTITFASTGSSVSINGYATTNGNNANAFTGTITSSTVISDLVGKTSGGGGSGPVDPTLTYKYNNSTTANVNVGTKFTATVSTNSNGAKTFSSDNTTVASVNETTGEITANAVGTAKIKVSVAKDGESYNAAEAELTVVVSDPKSNATALTNGTSVNVKNVNTEEDWSSYYFSKTAVWYKFTAERAGKVSLAFNWYSDKSKFNVYKNDGNTPVKTHNDVNSQNKTLTFENVAANDVFYVEFTYSNNEDRTGYNTIKATLSHAVSWNVTKDNSDNFMCLNSNNDELSAGDFIDGLSCKLYIEAGTDRHVKSFTVNGKPEELSNNFYSFTVDKAYSFEVEFAWNDVTLSVGDAGLATMYYSNLDLTVPADVEAFTYTYNSTDDAVEATKYEADDVIPAGTGVVVKAAKGNHTFAAADPTATKPANLVCFGSDAAEETSVTGATHYYGLQYNENRNNYGWFWMADDGAAFENGAHKAFLALTLTEGQEARMSFDLGFEQGTATAINAVSTATAKSGKMIENSRLVIVKDNRKFNAAGQLVK